MPLFEVAVVQSPTPDREKAGDQEKLIFGPKAIIAKDRKTAILEAMKAGAQSSNLALSRILVRAWE